VVGQCPSKSNYRRGQNWSRIRQWEDLVGWAALNRIRELGWSRREILERWPVPHVTIHAHKQRIDVSNSEKLVLDALEGILYENDRHVGVTAREKHGGTLDASARLEVWVTWKGEQQ